MSTSFNKVKKRLGTRNSSFCGNPDVLFLPTCLRYHTREGHLQAVDGMRYIWVLGISHLELSSYQLPDSFESKITISVLTLMVSNMMDVVQQDFCTGQKKGAEEIVETGFTIRAALVQSFLHVWTLYFLSVHFNTSWGPLSLYYILYIYVYIYLVIFS